ncbi:ArsR/SmtB family transcription factor [Acidiferrimicrobium sp. IK]|uniref:ArsR/SmtB family transcription factor n=1 Tax=Acidiferrimicrobium sp. IK TaxID=2871700 RepID=UPI00396712CB
MFALSTPSRVQILCLLSGGPRTVGDLCEGLDMEQSAVSHQLRILREHQLVRADRVGRSRVYELASEHLIDLLSAAVDHVERSDPRSRRSRRGVQHRASSVDQR